MLNLLIDNNINVSSSNIRHGFGLFETIRIRYGVPLYLDAHIKRLASGTRFLGMEAPPSWEEVLEFLIVSTDCFAMKSGALRLLAIDSNLYVTILSCEPNYPKTIVVGLSNIVTRFSRDIFTRFKTISYIDNKVMALEAERRGLYEVIALNENNDVTDGSRTNVFLVINGQLVTPRMVDGALPGIIRGILLNAKLASEARVTVADLGNAEAMMLTNALHKITPVHTFYWCKEHTLDATHPLIMSAISLIT